MREMKNLETKFILFGILFGLVLFIYVKNPGQSSGTGTSKLEKLTGIMPRQKTG